MATEGAIIPQLVESITQSSSPSSTATTCSVTMAGGDISSSAHSTIPCHTEVVLDEKTKKELFTDTFCRVCGAVLQFEAHRNAHYEGKRHAQKVRLYFLKQELEELTYKKKQKGDHVEFRGDKGLSLDKNRFCSLCNMVFSSPVVAQSHYIGKIHAKKLKQTTGEQNEWSLSLEENAQSETAVANESNDTLSPLTEKSNQPDTSEDLSCADNAIDLSDPNKYCKLCCASFNKPLVAQQHYNGKKHARNEARRKMMEAMGDTGVPMDSGGDGIFVCPICNITLTSIEMYQSHMQGNKHQIKETMVANVMRTTKKSYDSFQDELADYIKVQKARGLEPKTQLRQNKDQSDSCEEEEPVPAPIHPKANHVVPYKYPPPPHPMPYPAYGPPHPRLAGWDKPYWPQKPMPKLPSKAIPHRKHPRSSPDSSSESSSSDESSGSYKKEKRHKREHRSKERKHHSKSRRENGSSERKKRKTEDSDSGKDEGEREKKNEEVSADKSKHRKDKKRKEESSADKDSKKHKKTKKNVDQRTEEELLWDESILGF